MGLFFCVFFWGGGCWEKLQNILNIFSIGTFKIGKMVSKNLGFIAL